MKFFIHSIVFLGIGFGLLYGYLNYGDDIYYAVFDEPAQYSIFVGTVGVSVTLADTYEERVQGLSGTEPLRDLEGKLFLFDTADEHGIWMKEMNYPLDILWINNNLEIIHIEENVSPESYPQVFSPTEPARYVLEMKAFFVSTYKIKEGQKLLLPPALLPEDIKANKEEEYANK